MIYIFKQNNKFSIKEKSIILVKSPPRPTRFTRNREATTTTTSSTTNTAIVTTKAGSASGPNGNQTTTASSKPSVEASKVVPDKTKEEDFTSSQETMPPPEGSYCSCFSINIISVIRLELKYLEKKLIYLEP